MKAVIMIEDLKKEAILSAVKLWFRDVS